MSSWSWKAGLTGVAIIAAGTYALAQMPGLPDMHRQMQGGQMHDRMMSAQMPEGPRGMPRMPGRMGMTGLPTMPGQDAFGAIQEVVRILEADPTTDWTKVDIAPLREHLIDMNEVTLHAAAIEHPRGDGIEIEVTGTGRTLDAIRRMVPAHVQELSHAGWNAKVADLPNGVALTVTSSDADQLKKLHALGFMGIMVQGAHHQLHHLAMAKGEFHQH